jgi:hypothetical protein
MRLNNLDPHLNYYMPMRNTTRIAFFAECLINSAKAILHSANPSAKPLPSVTLDKEHSPNISSAKGSLPSTFFWTLDKDFAECQKALGKKNTRQIKNRKN